MKNIHRNTFFYLGLLFSSLDSFPLFASISTYAPFISIICFFIYLSFENILKIKWNERKNLFALSIGFILWIYSFFNGIFIYSEFKGFISFTIQFICALILLISFNIYFKNLASLYPKTYCESFANLFLKANFPILIIGLIEIVLINFPNIYNQILSFISHRVSLERIQLISGEPSWASRLILTLLVFIPFTSFAQKKKIRLYFITLLLLFFTGSTLGIICYVLYLILTYLKKENIKWIIITVLLGCILFPYIFKLLDPYTQKRLLLLSNLHNEDWLSIAVNSGSGSIMSRIGNPILGIYMGFDYWLLGVGGGYYSHFYSSYLANYFPEALSIGNIEVVGNSAKNLFCRIFAEFGVLISSFIVIKLIKLYHTKINNNIKLKGIYVCMILLTINFDSLFHIYPLLLFCFLLNHPTQYAKKTFF